MNPSKSLRHSTSVTTFAINFVADAWGDFIDRVTDEANAGILYKDGPYYEMKAKKPGEVQHPHITYICWKECTQHL